MVNVTLEVRISEQSGLPYTSVPDHSMWDLVEYLGAQRTNVLYGYSTHGFTVTFHRLDAVGAQKLLDEWAASRNPKAEYPENETLHSDNLCYLPG